MHFRFFVAGLLMLLLRAPAQAQEASAPTTWAVAVEPQSLCVHDPNFRAQLEAQIPDALRAPVLVAELVAMVNVTANGVASIRVLDTNTRTEVGRREITLSSADCELAVEGVGLVLGVLVESGRAILMQEASRQREREAAEPPPEDSARAEERAEEDADAEARRQAEEETAARAARKRQRHAWLGPPPGHDLRLAVGSSYGLLPGFALGGTVGWGVRWSRVWPVWFDATGWLNELTEDRRAGLGAAFFGVATCPLHWESERLRIRLCPGLSFGAVWGFGRGFPRSDRSLEPLGMIGAQGALHVKIAGPFELTLDARADVPLARLQFVYDSEDGGRPALHRTSIVNASLFGGFGLRFR